MFHCQSVLSILSVYLICLAYLLSASPFLSFFLSVCLSFLRITLHLAYSNSPAFTLYVFLYLRRCFKNTAFSHKILFQYFFLMFRQRLRRTVKIVDRLLEEDDLDMDGLIRQEPQPIQYNSVKCDLEGLFVQYISP